jgi:hypothetical protein
VTLLLVLFLAGALVVLGVGFALGRRGRAAPGSTEG